MFGAALIGISVFAQSVGTIGAADLTTKFRVYQNDNILREFADYNQAVNYAKGFSNSHVEEIGSRKWRWDNFARYKVYQNGKPLPWGEFATLQEAIREAAKWGNSSVRDLRGQGWVWNNYAKPGYTLYQGDTTLDTWTFATLEQAKAEAKKWGHAHIIDNSSKTWVWDNYPEADKQKLRSGELTYQVYQGSYTNEQWRFAFIEDAIKEAAKWGGSTVVNKRTGKTVHSNVRPYEVKQFNTVLDSFMTLEQAIAYAQKWSHAKVLENSTEIWNNYPYYQVFQNNTLIGEFQSIPESLAYSMKYANSAIRTYEGIEIWDNLRKLQFWAWNGVSGADTIRSHVAQTQGLDVDSPSWFSLTDASGNLTDKSNAATVAELKKLGIGVHPLVTNQFDAKLTTQFLSSADAQRKFIDALVKRCAELKVDGINVDFESMAGSDRAKYTEFLRNLTKTAHDAGLIISVDLPRGSAAWNEKTAFDHEAIAGIVDYVITMTYDHHYSGSPTPGSVAGLQWVEQGIKEFLAYGIPRDKLIIGIPFYVRQWKLDSSGNLVSNSALLMKNLPKLIEEKKAVSTWDERFQQYKVEYKEDGFTYVFWLEDESTVKARIALAKKYDLAGVAAWRLGYDSAELWNTMIREK